MKCRNIFDVKSIVICSIILQLFCSWPYSPEKEAIPNSNTDTGDQNISGSGIVYEVNVKKQTCNPSISQDQINYPACMIWLGFDGDLEVNIPNSIVGYTTKNVLQHDRITISDTSNNVRWFILNTELGLGEKSQIQDPEWSAHPDYIACLGEDEKSNWDGYAIRISDKACLKLCEDKMIGVSTPHIWLPDSITSTGVVSVPEYNLATGFIIKSQIQQFFGTTNVKIVYSVRTSGLSVYYVDYNDINPKPVALVKPKGKEIWDCESPLISPEGNWVVYNCAADLFTNSSYIQRLKPDIAPVIVTENGYEPHWWVNPKGDYYIIYNSVVNGKVVQSVLSDPNVQQSGSAGKTIKQKLMGSAGNVPVHMGLCKDGEYDLIVDLPFKGGMSPDGNFLCTGYIYTYLMQLN